MEHHRRMAQASLPLLLRRALIGGALPACLPGASAGERIEISMSDASPLGDVVAAVLQRAYEKMDMELVVRKVPLRRSLLMANAGEVDGEMMRTLAALQDMPQLLPVRCRRCARASRSISSTPARRAWRSPS